MSSSIPVPEDGGFKFREPGDSGDGAVSSVQKVAKLETYIVAYKDGEGRVQTRVVFRIPGADMTFMINERISGSNVVVPTHGWFHKELSNKLRSMGEEKGPHSEAAPSV